MGNEQETSQVIFSIQKAAFLMDPFFKVATVGTAFLITYLARMAKEGKISRGEFNSVQEFMKATEGKYTIVNVPYNKNYSPWVVQERKVNGKIKYFVQNQNTGEIVRDKKGSTKLWDKAKRAEKEMESLNNKESLALGDLQELGIRHVILPDLDIDDGMVQIALFNDDKEKFIGWQERYLINRMQGGELELRDLRNLTSGNTTIISIPVEGAELDKLKADFRELKINYAILPDLNIGDGETQMVVANSDIGQVEFWHKMYNQDLIKQGEEPRDMQIMTMEGYTNTGNLTEEQYVDTASEELVKANEKYEGRAPGEVENAVKKGEGGVRSMSSEAYETYAADNGYVQLSVDKESLVNNSRYAGTQEISDKGLFACRIPGTYAENEMTLVVPQSQVFVHEYNGGTNYRVFLKKGDKPMIMDASGNPVPDKQKITGAEVRENYFDPVKQQREKTQRKMKNKAKDLNNFERRDYDFADLEKRFLESELGPKI